MAITAIHAVGKEHRKFNKTPLIFGVVVSVFALLICGLGIWLIYLKSGGKTHFRLFGQEFQSDNVGVACIFIGAVVLIFALRRTFKSLDTINRGFKDSVSKILSPDDYEYMMQLDESILTQLSPKQYKKFVEYMKSKPNPDDEKALPDQNE